jgi:hypothetical protein
VLTASRAVRVWRLTGQLWRWTGAAAGVQGRSVWRARTCVPYGFRARRSRFGAETSLSLTMALGVVPRDTCRARWTLALTWTGRRQPHGGVRASWCLLTPFGRPPISGLDCCVATPAPPMWGPTKCAPSECALPVCPSRPSAVVVEEGDEEVEVVEGEGGELDPSPVPVCGRHGRVRPGDVQCGS